MTEWNRQHQNALSALPLGLGMRCVVAILLVCGQAALAQTTRAKTLLARGLYLADLYNWADAAPAFAEAEILFNNAGDRRNAFYAHLGRIRGNIERDQRGLPEVSYQLANELHENSLLQGDKELRMFCLIVKGDIDTEMNTGEMRSDWLEVEELARDLRNQKWQYRALAQLGVAAFYDADVATARKNVGSALEEATKVGDTAAQVRFLVFLANGLLYTKTFDQAVSYLDNAITLASTVADAGYQFSAQELRVEALIGLKQIETAQRAVNEFLTRAREGRRGSHEATGLALLATIAAVQGDRKTAIGLLEKGINLAKAEGLVRLLAGIYSQAAEFHRAGGDLDEAERALQLAADSTQESGDLWAVPQRLLTLAQIQVARGRYTDADRVYDRAEAIIESLIGSLSTALEKTAVITASSQVYTEHFALVAGKFNDASKAYAIIERARGRVAADLLAAGSVRQPQKEAKDQVISQLKLKLMAARSTQDVRKVRDQIFMAEQTKWVTPGVNILKRQSRGTIGIKGIQESLPPSGALLEYVIADPVSYCLYITRTSAGIVPLGSKTRIEALIGAYLKAVKAGHLATLESRELYNAIVRPVREASRNRVLVVIRDGQLHLVPFDALRQPSGRYVAEDRTVLYSPSATTFYLLAQDAPQHGQIQKAFFAVGGIPYSRSPMNRAGRTRGYDLGGFADLPSSEDEIRIAQNTFPKNQTTLLVGRFATEAAFKREPLEQYRVIHLSVHAFADRTFPDRAALVLLSDPAAHEDGFLQASEVAQLRLEADLAVLSACDTAVGALTGQEGIANLSRAFLLAGARTVVSTLWEVDDSSSLFLMRRFYAHLAAHQPPATALTAAKLDMLRTFGRQTTVQVGSVHSRRLRSVEHGRQFQIKRTEEMVLDAKSRAHILRTIKHLVLANHINIAGVDYQAWASQVDARTPNLLKCDIPAFESGVRQLLTDLKTSHTAFYHSVPKELLPQHSINASLREVGLNDSRQWMFLDVFESGPAHVAGIKPGDILEAVDDAPVAPPTLPHFGIGQKHKLLVRHLFKSGKNEHTIDVPMRKGTKQRPPIVEPKSPIHLVVAPKVGVLKIPYFPGAIGMGFAAGLDSAINDLKRQGCDRLIIDLRGNIGGSLGFARLASYMCPDQIPIGYSLTPKRLRNGYDADKLPRVAMPSTRAGLVATLCRYAFRDKSVMLLSQGLGPQPFHGRIVLLINEWTNSAAEMLANFASENGLATTVGQRTRGNVLGAANFKLDAGYWLRLPVFGWFSSQGRNIEGHGVEPEFAVDISPEALNRGEDTQLIKAIEILGEHAKPAIHDHLKTGHI